MKTREVLPAIKSDRLIARVITKIRRPSQHKSRYLEGFLVLGA